MRFQNVLTCLTVAEDCVDLLQLLILVEINQIFGIEMAREVIKREILNVMNSSGIYLNKHHVNLLCDYMTHKGVFKALNRHGINNAFLPMAIGAGMTSAIMNPVALPVGPKRIAEKRAEIEAAGIILPDGMDDEAFVQMFGMGSTLPRPGKEMEAIRAANLLTNNDDGGAAWISFNKQPAKPGQEGRGRAGRTGGRRRRG